jgi:predicted porin
MKHRKTQVAAAVGAALLVGASAAQAQVTPVSPSQPGLTVQLYGQVNRAMMHADDGSNSKWFFVDGQPSSTRFGVDARGNVMPGLTAGARLETEIRSNRSNEVTFAAPATATQTFTERWMDVFIGGAWGQINLGQGSGAADGANEVNLHGAGLALSNPMSDFGGGILFTTGAGVPTANTVDSAHSNLDYESRNDRLMYTTPTFGGFRVQAGVGQVGTGEAKEASLWYSGKFAGDFQAALGWSDVNVGSEHRVTIGGSAAWLHSSGFNVAGTYAERELGGTAATSRDVTYWSAAVGYKVGPHAIALKYEVTEDLAFADSEVTGIGLGYVWTPIRWADIYAGYIVFQPDGGALSGAEDIKVGMVGTRVRF